MVAFGSTLRHGVALAVIAALATGCKRAGAGTDSTKTAKQAGAAPGDTAPGATSVQLPVAVEPARDGDLVLSIITSGQVRSEHEVHVKAEVGGTVQRVLIKPGQTVTKGQILVELDQRPFELTMRQRQLELDKATQAYRDLWVPDSVATGRSPTADRLKAALTRSGLPGAQLNFEQAQLDNERASIKAPFAGVIDRVDVVEGEKVGGGGSIATVVDMQHLRIEAAVLESNIGVIKEGGVATVASAASPDKRFYGKIVTVLPLVDSTSHAGRAYVQLEGNGILRPGMTVDVRLEAKRFPHVRLVPKAAVIERDGRPLVFVVQGGVANWVYIRRGRDNGIDTEVLPDSITNELPVKPGDQVIIRGHLTLSHQTKVRIVPKSDRP